MVGSEAQQGFERNMAIEAPIVAKREFVEIGVDVPAAEAVICAERPSLEQRESAMAPRQDDVTGHGADDARIVPIVTQPWIRCVPTAVRLSASWVRGTHCDMGVFCRFLPVSDFN